MRQPLYKGVDDAAPLVVISPGGVLQFGGHVSDEQPETITHQHTDLPQVDRS